MREEERKKRYEWWKIGREMREEERKKRFKRRGRKQGR